MLERFRSLSQKNRTLGEIVSSVVPNVHITCPKQEFEEKVIIRKFYCLYLLWKFELLFIFGQKNKIEECQNNNRNIQRKFFWRTFPAKMFLFIFFRIWAEKLVPLEKFYSQGCQSSNLCVQINTLGATFLKKIVNFFNNFGFLTKFL